MRLTYVALCPQAGGIRSTTGIAKWPSEWVRPSLGSAQPGEGATRVIDEELIQFALTEAAVLK